MGISRSATIVIAYLMNRFGMTLSQAYNYVKIKRPEIGPNRHFMRTLIQYEQELRYPKSLARTDLLHSRNQTSLNHRTTNLINNANYGNSNNNNMNAYLTAPRIKKKNNNRNSSHNNVKTNNNRPISALLAETKFKEIERNLRYTPFFSNELNNFSETAPELLKRA